VTIEALLAQYGVLALFIGAGIEGETVVVLGGVMVHRGIIPFVPAAAAAAMGSFVADQIFFSLGRRFRGHRFVRRLQASPAFSRAIAAFDKRPTLFVFGFRFLYGLRTVSPIAIGTTRLPVSRFITSNALAALVWGLMFVTLGYFFGQAVEAAFGRVRDLSHVLLPILAVLLIVGGTIHLVRRRRQNKSPG
jgi:membrane protein DedA with SNARE-associated domain